MARGFFLKALLDTCTFLWLVRGDSSLTDLAREIISDALNEIYLSPVSAWEIGVKHKIGKLSLPCEPSIFVPRETNRHKVGSWPLNQAAALVASGLPLHHKDPFDRLLVGQAVVDGLTILTPDPLIRQYSATTLW